MKTKKKNIKWTQIARRLMQFISFVAVPGLFISTFYSIKAVYTAAIGGTFSFSALLPQILILAAVIPATILFGRVFCSFLCSFGAFGDLIWFLSKKLRRHPPVIGEKADRALKGLKYIILAFIVVFIWTLGMVTIDSNLNPWTVFGTYATPSGWSSVSALLSVGAALLALIIVGSFFVERFFCRYLCPLGAIFGLLSRLRLLKVKRPENGCGACRVCTSNCPMGIPMYKYGKISSGECISCFACTNACPRGNLKATVAGKDAAPLAAGLIASAAMLGFYYVGRAAAEKNDYTALASVADVSLTDSVSSGSYKDGVYTGSAQGYKGTTTVRVTVENGCIGDIEVLSTGDDSEFFNIAKASIISSVISAQSTDVDAVTGATYSSDAITDAVAAALGTASEEVEAQDPVQTQAPSITVLPLPGDALAVSGDYPDGVYTGTGTGYRGSIEVAVTVSGGNITNIEILSSEDDRPYLNSASSVAESIISSQSVEVDAVSGATFSSNGIMEAVADALSVDFTNPNNTLQREHGGFHGGWK